MLVSGFYKSKWGNIKVCVDTEVVHSIQFSSETASSVVSHPLLDKTFQQLQAYENDATFVFDLPLKTQGTTFQNRVWQALLSIPSSQTQTYLAIANKLQNHPRAVGQACKKNPWIIVVPCHRVVAQNHLGGYAGHTQGTMWQNKKELLEHEALL